MKAYLEIVELKDDVVTVSGACVGPQGCDDCYEPTIMGDQCYTDES